MSETPQRKNFLSTTFVGFIIMMLTSTPLVIYEHLSGEGWAVLAASVYGIMVTKRYKDKQLMGGI